VRQQGREPSEIGLDQIEELVKRNCALVKYLHEDVEVLDVPAR